jgi:hypothetical protein
MLPSITSNGFAHDSTSQPPSYDTVYFNEERDPASAYHDTQAAMWNIGLELDLNLEYDIYGIEGLLSNEVLDWFSGAVISSRVSIAYCELIIKVNNAKS